MNLDLAGKTAIVTGASRGIGLATVRALQGEGVGVVAAARKPTRELDATGARFVPVDLAGPDGGAALVGAIRAEVPVVDFLVNAAGGGDRLSLKGFADLDEEDWLDALSTNLLSAVRTTRAALELLTAPGAAVVNVSSIGARRPEGPPLAYNVAKAALTAFSRGVAAELGPRGVRVVTVSPGPTRTDMWEAADGLGGQLAQALGAPIEAVVAGAPEQIGMVTGRLAEPVEVASLITYLLSPLAANITGSDHLVDGGAIRAA
jgi:NAD(P)-dependent dehydrogenase (short-subunit alcohol dehydrogenase family)